MINVVSDLNNFPKWCYTLSTNNPMYNNGLKKPRVAKL